MKNNLWLVISSMTIIIILLTNLTACIDMNLTIIKFRVDYDDWPLVCSKLMREGWYKCRLEPLRKWKMTINDFYTQTRAFCCFIRDLKLCEYAILSQCSKDQADFNKAYMNFYFRTCFRSDMDAKCQTEFGGDDPINKLDWVEIISIIFALITCVGCVIGSCFGRCVQNSCTKWIVKKPPLPKGNIPKAEAETFLALKAPIRALEAKSLGASIKASEAKSLGVSIKALGAKSGGVPIQASEAEIFTPEELLALSI